MTVARVPTRQDDRVHHRFDRTRRPVWNAARLIGIERFDLAPVARAGEQVVMISLRRSFAPWPSRPRSARQSRTATWWHEMQKVPRSRAVRPRRPEPARVSRISRPSHPTPWRRVQQPRAWRRSRRRPGPADRIKLLQSRHRHPLGGHHRTIRANLLAPSATIGSTAARRAGSTPRQRLKRARRGDQIVGTVERLDPEQQTGQIRDSGASTPPTANPITAITAPGRESCGEWIWFRAERHAHAELVGALAD